MESLEDIQKHIAKIIYEQNNQGLPDFEGYSPSEMQVILYDTFGEYSPVQLVKLTETDYKNIPILNQIRFVSELISKEGELKLTGREYLPPKIVKEIYNQGFLKDEFLDAGIFKLNKEKDSMTISLTKILILLSGIVKKRNNKLSLTKKGKKLLSDNHKLLKQIFSVFGSKLNWAYFDGYGENNIGQLGFGFSLVLLSKYGNTKHLDTFYSEKYFKAFPQLIDESIKPTFDTPEKYASVCYSLRTFDRFLVYFGLIKIERGKKWNAAKYISKTDLFEKLIKILPHNDEYNLHQKGYAK